MVINEIVSDIQNFSSNTCENFLPFLHQPIILVTFVLFIVKPSLYGKNDNTFTDTLLFKYFVPFEVTDIFDNTNFYIFLQVLFKLFSIIA